MNNDRDQANFNEHQVRMIAEQDAETDATKILWILAGFFLSLIGLLIAYIYQPTPAATRLLEKSQQYILFYTEAYIAKSRNIQLLYTAVGLAISIGIGFLIFLFGIALIGSMGPL